MLYNERAIKKVLTCLYLDNDLIISPDYPLSLNDFALKKYQAIYSSLYNLYSLGNNNIDISDIIGYFQQQATMYGKFVEDGGIYGERKIHEPLRHADIRAERFHRFFRDYDKREFM